MTLAEKIIDYRARENITQKEFAKRCGLSTMTIHKAENDKVIKLLTARKIEQTIFGINGNY